MQSEIDMPSVESSTVSVLLSTWKGKSAFAALMIVNVILCIIDREVAMQRMIAFPPVYGLQYGTKYDPGQDPNGIYSTREKANETAAHQVIPQIQGYDYKGETAPLQLLLDACNHAHTPVSCSDVAIKMVSVTITTPTWYFRCRCVVVGVSLATRCDVASIAISTPRSDLDISTLHRHGVVTTVS